LIVMPASRASATVGDLIPKCQGCPSFRTF
jgi:hypothetical protein